MPPIDKNKDKPKRSYSKNKFPLAGDTPSTSSVSSPQRLRAAPSDTRSKWQKMEDVLKIISTDFVSMGEFLETLFYIHPRAQKTAGVPDPRSSNHQSTVTTLLQGTSKAHISHIITLIYSHPQSQPSASSSFAIEREPAQLLMTIFAMLGRHYQLGPLS